MQVRKKLLLLFGALLIAGSLPLSGTFAESTVQFSDVPSSKHYAEAVYELADRKIIGGYPDGTFKPGNSITRGQAAAIIAKMIGLDTTNVKNPGFKDVSTANGYYKAIAAMAEKGIIGGYADGRYGPNDPIKRGQMASILVKAFDLPRDGDIENPFKDVGSGWDFSHTGNTLIIYKLGITSGTSSDTFSPNAAITRGQAAKMLRATEEVKLPTMVTFEASDFEWDRISTIVHNGTDKELIKPILVKGKEGYTQDKIQLIPLKEGTGKLNITGIPSEGSNAKNYKKYYVDVKKVNGELQLTLEETEDVLPTEVSIYSLSEKLQNISLSTMNGEKVSDSVPFEQDFTGSIDVMSFDLDKPGQYIATFQFESGEKVRYGIEAKQDHSRFYYEIKTLRENLSDIYEESDYSIGKHIIRTKGAAEQIAEITRDPDTNLFRVKATGQKEGTITIDYEHSLYERHCDYMAPECYTAWTGLYVKVQQIGSIVNVDIRKNVMIDH